MIETIPNTTSGNMRETHILAIPPCCPVSKNPRPGSKIMISYHPRGQSLEIASLIAYIHSFRGGLRNANGELEVRDMEGMIEQIASDCHNVLGLPVEIETHLYLLPKQEMRLLIRKGE